MKKTYLLLISSLLITLLPAYMTIGNEVYLKVLVKLDKMVTLKTDGLIFINGQEYRSKSLKISLLNNGEVKLSFDHKSLKDDPYKFEISLTGNFFLSGNTKQHFSGDIHLREHKGKLAVMNLMNLESYTRYVVVSEIGSGAPDEALKSQAVIARTYAIHQSMKNSNYPWDLRADTYSQVFNTKKRVPQNVIDATNATAYMLVTYKGQVAFTPFNSYSGGYLANVEQVWGGKGYPYLADKTDVDFLKGKKMNSYRVVEDWIRKDPAKVYNNYNKLPNWIKDSYQWKRTVSLSTVASKGKFSKIYSAKVDGRDDSGRISKITFNTASGKKTITSQDRIRALLGGIPSTLAIIKVSGNNLIIEGKGNGHGVGFCQSGGYLKSYAGWDYVRIIKHYYPGCEITSDYFWETSEEDELENLFN